MLCNPNIIIGSFERPFDSGQKRRFNLDINFWELPDIFQKPFARYVKRDGELEYGSQKLKLD